MAADVLALRSVAGNRAMAQLVARKPDDAKQAAKTPAKKLAAKKPATKQAEPAPLDAHDDFTAAMTHIGFFYDGVRSLLELEDKIREQAMKNFKEYSDLKDPPSIAGAIFAEVFSQIVGLVPGGKFVQAAMTAGVFARQMAKLEKEYNEYPIPEVSIEDDRAKGPSDATKAKVEKVYGHGKTAVDAGKAVVGAALKAAEQQAAASAAEAQAQENAAKGSGRISVWREATELTFLQEKALRDRLELARRRGADPGKLKALVMRELGERPRLTQQLQDKLEREYELALYRDALRMATVKSRLYRGTELESESIGTHLELAAGGKPAQALLRRVADLLGAPHLAAWPNALGNVLKVKSTYRESTDKRPAYSGNRV